MLSRAQKRSDAAVRNLLSGLDVTDGFETGRHGLIPVRRYKVRNSEPTRALVWLHGGAFSHGGLDQLESHAAAAAIAQTGTVVTAVDYRRVPAWSWFKDAEPGQLPGIRFPIPLDDAYDAFTAVRESTPGEVSLGGASAGACLAAAAAARLASDGNPASRVVLAYGTFHAQLPALDSQLRSRIRGRHRFTQFNPVVVRRMNHNYAGTTEKMLDPSAFPGGHTLPVLPLTLMLDADRDSLRASGQSFAAEMRDQGTRVDYWVVPNATHGFLDRPATRSFAEATERIGRFLGS